MNKLVFYPAIFHKAEDGGFWISFPDLPECLTEGNDMTQAYEMAVNAPIPEPSAPSDIIVEKDSFLVVVEFDILAYKKRTSPRAVKKTLSIPEWLNEEATAIGVNFSQVLQEALMQKLQTK